MKLDKPTIIIIVCTIIIILAILYIYKSVLSPAIPNHGKPEAVKTAEEIKREHDAVIEAERVKYPCDEDKDLSKIRKKIFPLKVTDVKLNDQINTESNYWRAINVLQKHTKTHKGRTPTVNELLTLLIYKKFIDSPEINSMCSDNDIDQLKHIVLKVLKNKVHGCFIETGCWRSGQLFWMRAIDQRFGDKTHPRRIYGFDTFTHFPKPENIHITDGSDKDVRVHELTEFMYENYRPLSEIKDRGRKFGLIDDSLVFVEGLIEETVPRLEKDMKYGGGIAILRVDNDYYDSVLLVLEYYYKYIRNGGYVIIDDYNNEIVGCKEAVDFFREKHHITIPIVDDYKGSVYWKVK